MTQPIGRLQAYLDGELVGSELDEVSRHLKACAACRTQLGTLAQTAGQTATHLTSLEPMPSEVMAAWQALAVFQARTHLRTQPQPVQPQIILAWIRSLWKPIDRRFGDMTRTFFPSRPAWRMTVMGLTAITLLVVLFTVAPARDAMAQFLGVFRVQQFVAVPIDADQTDRQKEILALLDSGLLGEPEFLREPGEPQIVADTSQATVLARFDVQSPSALPVGASVSEVHVVVGPHLRMSVDRSTMEMGLILLGMDGAELPDVESITAEIDVPAIVSQAYAISNPNGRRDAKATIIQAPAPDVDIPPGIDPTAMGELYLQVSGVPAAEARRLAQTIDWTSTFVLPVPTDVGSYRELTIHGQPALLVEEKPDGQGFYTRVLLWQRNGIVYAIEGHNIADSALMQMAESME